jgi:hypothetical protein
MNKPTEPRCPDCGCRVQDHNNVNRVTVNPPCGPLVLAHCGNCGLCWKCTAEFTELVRKHLELQQQAEQVQQ